MRNILTFIFTLTFFSCFATNYYVSSTGNNTTGLSPATAWQSITVLNTKWVSVPINPGDSILFNRGETFYGGINLTRSGSAALPIVLAAYGTGAAPIITGLTTVTGWVSIGTNLWEAPVVGVRSDVTLVTRNGAIQQLGRFPNANAANGGYLNMTAATTLTLTGPALSTTTNWTRAEVAVRAYRWEIRRRVVSSHVGGVVSWTTAIAPAPNGTYGYFFQRDAKTLDFNEEWYYNDTTKKLRMYSTTNPALYLTQIATVDTLLKTLNRSNITVANLAFTGGDRASILFDGGSGFIIKNCTSYTNGGEGFSSRFSTNVVIDRCKVTNSLASGIKAFGSTAGNVFLTVTNDTVTNTSLLAGMGQTDVSSARGGIFVRGGVGTTVTNNIVTNSGYNGIWASPLGNTANISYNFIDTFCTTLDDGGGIYVFTIQGNTITNGTNRRFAGNIVNHGIGNQNGGGVIGPSANGIYPDEGTRDIVMDSNVVANTTYNSFQGNNNSGMTITNNVVYNMGKSWLATQKVTTAANTTLFGFNVKRNIIYPYRWWLRDQARNLPTNVATIPDIARWVNGGGMDSNYYSIKPGPVDTSANIQTDSFPRRNATIIPPVPGSFLQIYQNFAYITGTLGLELHSIRELITTGTLEYAAQSSARLVTFPGLSKRDVYGNIYNNSVSIPAWYGKILIDNGTATAKKYYVCATGDNTTGLDSAHAWQTIAKLNASMGSINAGDSVLFHKGETFYGSVVLTRSGSAGSPITFTSFGTGAKPIISGFTSMATWTLVGGNVWQCTPARTLKKNVNILTIAGVPQAVGRSAWFTYQTATPTVLTSTTLTGAPSFIGAEICIRANGVVAEKGTVTAQGANTVTYANNTRPIENGVRDPFITGTNGYGFFFQRYNTSLDAQGEWFFDSVANRMRIYSTVNPNTLTIKASSIDTVFFLANANYVTITGLTIEGGGSYGVESVAGASITVNNCSFVNNTKAVYAWNSNDVVVNDNTFDYSLNGAIFVNNTFAKRIDVNRNVVTNTGLFFGNGVYNSEHSLRGIVAKTDTISAANYVNVVGNTVTKTGSGSIHFQGPNVIVRRNITDTMASVIDGNGGIFTTIQNTSLNAKIYTNRVVDSNFVSNAIGAPLGAPNGHLDVAGIDMDDQTMNVIVKKNTIWNIPGDGIRINSANAITITDNLVYNSTNAIGLYKRTFGTIRNLSIRRNIFFPEFATQFAMLFNSGTVNDIPLFGTADSNYYARPIDDNLTFSTIQPSTGLVLRTLQGWQLFTSQDLGSKKAPKAITNVNELHFDTNPTSSPVILNFPGFSRMDVTGAIYTGAYTLPAWSGVVMMDTLAAAPNIPPVANAGPDKAITLPTNTTTVSGSGTDADGTIVGYRWVQISGPNTATIQNPTFAATNISNLIQGSYSFRFTVIDNRGDSGIDFMQVIVSPVVIPPNVPPIANAGVDQTITLPTSSVTVNGSGSSDPDGTIVGYLWSKVSGPTGGTIATPTAVSSNITALQAGTYVFRLRVTDNSLDTAIDFMQVVVNAANIPPTANAGADQSITLPTTTTTLVGTGSDPDGTIASYAWTKISGPTGGTITSPSSATTGITALQQGTYVFQLTVTDNLGLTGSDFVQVVVNPANVNPTADAGPDQEITLPTNSVTLTGSGTDPDGTIASYAWVKISGPTGGTVTSPSSATTTVTALQAGTYVFRLTVTDNLGLTGVDFVQIMVNPEPIVLPTADAGADQTITLPVNSVSVTGTATNGSGASSTYTWSQSSGPNAGTITTPSALTTTITGLIEGTYIFRFKVLNNLGDSAVDIMQVNVLPIIPPPNIPPTANAGGNQTITLPINSVNLTGAGSTDPDGTIVSYAWVQVSGPSTGVFGTPNAVTTTYGSLLEGTYLVRLTVTDNNGETGSNTITITVNAAPPNIPPTADAGADQSITLPTSTTTLVGSGTDPDGTIVGYLWRKLSGPAGGTITSNTSATTGITALGAGVYIYQLRVTDNSGDTATDAIQVTVNAANMLPIADAGPNQNITLPTTTTTLTGTGTDPDGTITGYLWRKISGPTGGAITTPTTAITGITGLGVGVYVYQLRVTDNAGDTATDAVQVTVLAANIPPTANAGVDQTVTLPTNNTTLFGSGTDADGTIVSYFWYKLSGPTGGDIVAQGSQTPQVEDLVEGVYIYQLRVTDNAGDTATDAVQVTVNPQPVNQLPVAVAGADQTITLPVDSTQLDGSASTDPDGSIAQYLWSKLAGPTGGAISSPNSAITEITGLVPGVYQYNLRVTDNAGDTAVDVVQVTVNQRLSSPIANVGVNQVFNLPTNSTSLVGSGTSFGTATIVSYLWQDVNGNPTTGTIQTPNSATTAVQNLVLGTYRYRLTVTDSNGLTGINVIRVTVLGKLPPNIPVLLRWKPL